MTGTHLAATLTGKQTERQNYEFPWEKMNQLKKKEKAACCVNSGLFRLHINDDTVNAFSLQIIKGCVCNVCF